MHPHDELLRLLIVDHFWAFDAVWPWLCCVHTGVDKHHSLKLPVLQVETGVAVDALAQVVAGPVLGGLAVDVVCVLPEENAKAVRLDAVACGVVQHPAAQRAVLRRILRVGRQRRGQQQGHQAKHPSETSCRLRGGTLRLVEQQPQPQQNQHRIRLAVWPLMGKKNNRNGGPPEFQIALLGASRVGKSMIGVRFVQGVYADNYDPKIEDSYRKMTEFGGQPCIMTALEPPLSNLFGTERDDCIAQAEGFIIVYSITDADSFQEAAKMWETICRIKQDPRPPIVLVGAKSDLESERVVTAAQGAACAAAWGLAADQFMEVSARTNTNIDQLFANIMLQVDRRSTQAQPAARSGCTIL
eukprot:m.312314 g.312314  ORF g.312314 m.312314 type:complete len:356 (+) comp55384_c1_seq9:564-1631(+)